MIIRRLVLALVASVMLVTGATTSAMAIPPDETTRSGGLHFVGQPDLVVGATTATATGEVAGAGRTATATLAVQWEVVRGCINRGSKDQQPSGLQRSFEETSGSATFNTRQGRGTFTVTTDPVTVEPFTCPDRMTPVLVSATAVSATLTITSQTGTITASWFSL